MSNIRSRIAVAPGQPFNINENIEYTSTSGSWIKFGAAAPGRAIRVQGVYWSCTTLGATLQIRDIRPGANGGKPGVVWYDVEVVNCDPASLDLFPHHITLFTPFEYYTSGSAGDTISIYGEYL